MAVLKLTQQLKAATLVETMVAMMVILFGFGLSMMLYTQVLTSENGAQKLNAHLLLSQLSIEARSNHYFVDATIECEGIIVHQRISKYRNSENLFILHLAAYDKNNRLLVEQQELIYQK